MSKISITGRLLQTTILAGVVSTAFTGAVVAQEEDDTSGDVIVITGSRLQNANITSTSPVTTIGEEAFDRAGVVDAVDVLNNLPSVTAAQDSNVSNGATGTASLNLRGLGSNRNLVLIDGKRLGPGRPDISSADLNQIPTPLLDRVEIVTGGASAVYGSDAIAGVANFILKRDFEGLELSANFSQFRDDNDNKFAQAVTNLSSTDGITPSDTQTDGETYDISAVFGTNFDNDRGNVTGFLRYVDQKAVLQGTRDISRCAIVDFGPEAGNDVFCVGSNFGPNPTTITLGAFDAQGNPITGGIVGVVSLDANGNVPRDANGDPILGSSNAFNFNPTNFFQRPTERIQGGFLANYQINDKVEAYLDATFFRNTTDAQIAPSATFGEIQSVNCDNPFLSAELVDIICTQRGFSGSDLAQVQINRRFVEGGGRNSFIELDSIRTVAGIRGPLANTGWDYDLFAQYSVTSQSDTNTNDGNINLLQEALLVTGTSDNPVCTSGRAGCLPLNLFGTSPVDTTALAAVLTPTILTGEIKQKVFGGSIQGELPELKFPSAGSPVAALIGFEIREDELKSQPDSILTVGGSTGLGGPSLPVDANAKVEEVFGEVAVPLINGREFFEELSFTAQYRYSEYTYNNNVPGGSQSDGTESTAYAAGLAWAPTSDVRFRAQYQRAVRAPNVFDLFDPQSLALFSDSDPCSGTVGSTNLTATVEQCQLTGLDPALYGLVAEDAGQLQQLTGGNTDLEPEKSDTYTLGAVITPSAIEGLTVSIDYFDITVEDFITGIPAASILDGCIDSSVPDFCNFINRDALGTLQVDGFIVSTDQNIAERSAKGFDVNARYQFDLADIGMGENGGLTIDYVATYNTELEQTSFPGAPVTDCLAVWGGSCFTGDITPEYGHTASLTWDSNFDIDVTATWRHIGEVSSQDNEVPVGGIGNVFDAENYLDLFASWDVKDDMTLHAGINNALDEDPPISDFRFTANGNTFPSTYDSNGRFLFIGGKLKF
ncbi:TonB-dependent receptor domain-containing protein [Parvularcula sp. IMCC14364]|uniref:TonB-dependent receptor domain-containing protein n=1 Tax=Parvularcula sp. IMCC14364 TaxID=3067902 RepID=UPI002741988E|nr:TonB-dependent receptor [Parvularcula sp. IMCC14364]